MEKYVLVLLLSLGVAKSELFCYHGLVRDITSPDQAQQLDACPNSKDYKCLSATAEAKLGGRNVTIGASKCVLSSMCDSNCRKFVNEVARTSGDVISGVTNCNAKCCSESYCNDLYSIVVDKPGSQKTTTDPLTCLSGNWVNDDDSSVQITTCETEFQQCSYATYVMAGVQYNSAGCSEASFCDLLSCDSIGMGLPIESCDSFCCDTNLCNDYTQTTLHGKGLKPILRKAPTVQEVGRTMINNKECKCNKVSGEKTDNTTLVTAPSSLCYAGLWSDGEDISTQEVCQDTNAICLVSRYTMDIVPGRVTVTRNSGQCIPREACERFTCDELKAAVAPIQVTFCRLHCCEGDLCNTHLALLEAAQKGKLCRVEMVGSSTVSHDTCIMRRRKHDSCCGHRSYNSKRLGCCKEKDRNVCYNLKTHGCCTGRKYKLNKFSCEENFLIRRISK